tara:strand:+ start:9171 stop:9857 length:687 start_codon:yes stop_codon:yes gene_type:complete
MLPTRHTHRHPLLHFDAELNTQRALRFATNQKSFFEDEQDGNAILEPIFFEDGSLLVRKGDILKQNFLDVHPLNGVVFEEVNNERDAQEDLDDLHYVLEAQNMAKDMSIEVMEAVGRVMLGLHVDKMSSAELKRDIMIYAERNPQDFLEIANDPKLQLENTAALLFQKGWLRRRNKNRDIFFNIPGNKRRMFTVPLNEHWVKATVGFFKTNEGIEAYDLLVKLLEDDK